MRLCLVSAILTLFISIQFQSDQWLLAFIFLAVWGIPHNISLFVRSLASVVVILTTLYSHAWLMDRLETRLPASASGVVVAGVGEVVGCRDVGIDVQKLMIRLESVAISTRLSANLVGATGENSVSNLKSIEVNYYRGSLRSKKIGKSTDIKEQAKVLAARISCGSVLKFEAKLRAPYGFINPWGFDYEAFMLSRKVDASGYFLHHEIMAEKGASLSSQLSMLREQGVQRAKNIAGLGGQIVPALLFGESGYLPRSSWSEFQLTGTIHLLVVSGLHVGFLVLFVTLIWYLLVRIECVIFFPRGSELFRLTPAILILVSVAYVYMAGMGLAIQRAGLMLCFGICVIYYRHYWSLLDTWLWVILLILIINPLSSLFVGFWFSFAAVGALLMSYCGQIGGTQAEQGSIQRDVQTKYLGGFVTVENAKLFIHPQWVVFIILMPLLWSFQQSQSLLSFFVNILAIPLLGVIIMPLAILSFLWPDAFFVDFLNLTLKHSMDFLREVSLLPAWLVYKPAGIWLVVLMPLVLLALGLCGMPFKRLSLLLLVVIFIAPVDGKKEELIVFDVGQGLAVYGSKEGVTWLYDTGAEFRSGFSLGEAVVAKNILATNGKRLDVLFVSHSDNDHAGGEKGLRRKIIPRFSYAGQPRLPHHLNCHLQEGWQTFGPQGYRWRTLNYKSDGASDNNQSCIVQIEMSGRKILLPGDIGVKVEKHLIDLYGAELKSDVLIVGHHGSKTSSGNQWLTAVAPSLAVVSSGFKNRFGHPHVNVMKRFKQLSIPIYNTAESGAIEINLSKEMSITQWRKKNPPLWRQM